MLSATPYFRSSHLSSYQEGMLPLSDIASLSVMRGESWSGRHGQLLREASLRTIYCHVIAPEKVCGWEKIPSATGCVCPVQARFVER